MASKEEIRRVSIYINGNEAELSLKQIEKGAAKLKNELGRLIPGTEEFKKKLLELRETRQVLQDVQDDIRGVGGAFGWLIDLRAWKGLKMRRTMPFNFRRLL